MQKCDATVSRPYSVRPTCRRFKLTLTLQVESRVKRARTSHVMTRFASVFAATLLSLWWHHALVECVYVKVPVQLAVSGDDFSSFGSINGDLEENVSLKL